MSRTSRTPRRKSPKTTNTNPNPNPNPASASALPFPSLPPESDHPATAARAAYGLLYLALCRLRYEDDVRALLTSPREIGRRVTQVLYHRGHQMTLCRRRGGGIGTGLLVAPVAVLMIPDVRSYSPLLVLNEEALADVVARPALALLDVLLACCQMHALVEERHHQPVFVANHPVSQRRWHVIQRKALIRQERARTPW